MENTASSSMSRCEARPTFLQVDLLLLLMEIMINLIRLKSGQPLSQVHWLVPSFFEVATDPTDVSVFPLCAVKAVAARLWGRAAHVVAPTSAGEFMSFQTCIMLSPRHL